MILRYLVVFLFSILILYGDDTSALFEKAFGKKQATIQRAEVPLYVNSEFNCHIFIVIKKNKVYLEKNRVEAILKYLTLKKDKVELNSNLIELSYLEKFKIETNFDKINNTIFITIPPKLRRVNKIVFNQPKKIVRKNLKNIENYSGAINFNFSQNYTKSNSKNFKTEPFIANSNLFFYLYGYIIEGSFNYDENREDKIQRGNIRVSYDDQKNKIRYSLGEINSPISSRISSKNIFGFSLKKNYSIGDSNYFNNIKRVTKNRFFLKRDSQVKIYINNHLYKIIHLKAGEHSLYDLPLNAGLNDIKLKIIDKFGKSENIDFRDFNYSNLMKQGVSSYGMGVGVERIDENGKITYLKNKPLASFYYYRGINSFWTLKGSSLVEKEKKTYSFESIIGTTLGLISPYYTYSNTKRAKGVTYQSNIAKINIYSSFNIEDSIDNNNSTTTKNYNLSLSRELFYKIKSSLSLNKRISNQEIEKSYYITLDKKITKDLDISLSYERAFKKEESSYKAYCSLRYTFGKKSTGEYKREIESGKIKNNYNYSYRDEKKGLFFDTRFDKTKEEKNYDSELELIDAKYNFNLNYSKKESIDNSNQNLNLIFKSGIAFSRDKFTLTKPLNSSFILVSNDTNNSVNLGIMDNQSRYKNFIIPINDYSYKTLQIDESSLPFGLSLKNRKSNFFSNYKSSSIMNIKIIKYYVVDGYLYEKNSTIKLKPLKIINTKTKKIYESFTTQKGRFIIEDLIEGEYEGEYFDKKLKKRGKFYFKVDRDRLKNSNDFIIKLNKIFVK